jgi:hypothetical protein
MSKNDESTFFEEGFEYGSKRKKTQKKKIKVNMETTGNKNAAHMEGRQGRLLGQMERLGYLGPT